MSEDIKWLYERSTGWYKATLKDRDGNIIGPINIASMRVTVYDERSDTVLSTTDAYSGGVWGKNVVLSTASTKNMLLTLSSADNAIIANSYMGSGGPFTYLDEYHIILVEGTTAGLPTSHYKIQYKYLVKNLRKVS